jgi:hypothetical protein
MISSGPDLGRIPKEIEPFDRLSGIGMFETAAVEEPGAVAHPKPSPDPDKEISTIRLLRRWVFWLRTPKMDHGAAEAVGAECSRGSRLATHGMSPNRSLRIPGFRFAKPPLGIDPGRTRSSGRSVSTPFDVTSTRMRFCTLSAIPKTRTQSPTPAGLVIRIFSSSNSVTPQTRGIHRSIGIKLRIQGRDRGFQL